jgi:hypothetical protein
MMWLMIRDLTGRRRRGRSLLKEGGDLIDRIEDSFFQVFHIGSESLKEGES